MWSQRDEKQFWLNWLEAYKNFKCLWDNDTKRKASREERQAAYAELANLAQIVNPSADTNFVRGRINAFRTCYRREFKKMEAARQNGIEYKPQLFYFDAMKFINIDEYSEDTIFESDSQTSIDNDPISCSRKDADPSDLLIRKPEITKRRSVPEFPAKVVNSVIEKRKKPKLDEPLEPDIAINIDTNLTKNDENCQPTDNPKPASEKYPIRSISEDEYEIFGKRIAAHFRNMQPDQRLIAEKIISDVCIYARMEKLNLESNINLAQVPSNHPKSEGRTEENIDYDDPDTYIYNT